MSDTSAVATVMPRICEVPPAVTQLLGQITTRFPGALVGALAVAHYAGSPAAGDVDFLVDARIGELHHHASLYLAARWSVAPLFLPNSMRGVPRQGLILRPVGQDGADVNVLAVDGDPFLKSVIERGHVVALVHKTRFRVARVEDLVVINMLSGRSAELEDALSLLRAYPGEIDQGYIDATMEDLMGQAFF